MKWLTTFKLNFVVAWPSAAEVHVAVQHPFRFVPVRQASSFQATMTARILKPTSVPASSLLLVLLLAAFAALTTCTAQQIATARVILYTATADFRHDSIPTAIQALHNQSSNFNVTFDSTEDQTKFSDENLALYDAIMFVSTTGEGK